MGENESNKCTVQNHQSGKLAYEMMDIKFRSPMMRLSVGQ